VLQRLERLELVQAPVALKQVQLDRLALGIVQPSLHILLEKVTIVDEAAVYQSIKWFDD